MNGMMRGQRAITVTRKVNSSCQSTTTYTTGDQGGAGGSRIAMGATDEERVAKREALATKALEAAAKVASALTPKADTESKPRHRKEKAAIEPAPTTGGWGWWPWALGGLVIVVGGAFLVTRTRTPARAAA